jgi:nucleotide-binding universal stress UspA family protein
MKILIAVDGSEYSRRAANYVAKHASLLASAPEVHLLHVHAPLPYPGAVNIIGKANVEKYQREESEAALAVAQKELEGGNVKVQSAWRCGDICEEVASYIQQKGIDLLVVGSHGRSAIAALAVGSVTLKLLSTIQTPVLVVR